MMFPDLPQDFAQREFVREQAARLQVALTNGDPDGFAKSVAEGNTDVVSAVCVHCAESLWAALEQALAEREPKPAEPSE